VSANCGTPIDNVRGSGVETDVTAYVVVDPLVGQRAEQDDERECRPQQLCREHCRQIDEVERLQPPDDVLDPRSLVAAASKFGLPTGRSLVV
jgi:hypothetical protein